MTNAPFSVAWPGRIVFGAGGFGRLGEEAASLGKRAFLATTAELTKLGLAGRAAALMERAGLRVLVYDGVLPDPSCLAVDAAAASARAEGCDLVVGLGGGSAIDFAKGVAVAATHEGPVWDYVTYTGAEAKPVGPEVLPVIAVPTTAGTGSELSKGTVLDHPIKRMKAALLSDRVYPRLALIDPELTYSMPREVSAMTGFDALTHGIEGFLNAARSNPCADLFCLEAARLARANLPRVLADGGDREARAAMSWAAALGGIAIGLSNTTVAHAMGLPLGSRLHVPHGLGLSRLLPAVLARSWEAQPSRFAALADAVGASRPGMSERERARSLVDWLVEFVGAIGLAASWRGGEVDGATLDLLTEDVFAYMGRPVRQHMPVFDRAGIKQIYTEALRA